MITCPFCGCDPYHYVDNGVGMEAVAITCCELGVEYFTPPHKEPSETVTISRGTFESFAEVFRAMRTLGMSPELEHG
jgi:hypothetical protein